MRILSCIIILSFALGCDKPNLTPEEDDPIYKDLLNEAANAEKAIEEQEKKVLEGKEALDKIVPQKGQTKRIYGQYFFAREELSKLKEKAEYYKVAAKNRKYEARKSYLSAFKTKAAWPDPKDFDNYKQSKSTWFAKTQHRKPATTKDKSKSKGKKGSEHGEEHGESPEH